MPCYLHYRRLVLVPTLIVSDSSSCMQGYNVDLKHWCLNGFKDSKRKPIKNKQLWGRIAFLWNKLQLAHVIHTLSHQRYGFHAKGNHVASHAVKGMLLMGKLAAITQSQMKIETNVKLEIKMIVLSISDRFI